MARSWPEAPELVGRLDGLTLHRLLGWRPDNATRFRHDRANRLKYDVVVVDESSMVELTMMGRLLEALRPECRLVLVGDPRQLTSVGAGAVLSDLVAGYDGRADSPVSALTENFRSEEDIKALAAALRDGDADEVLRVLRAPSEQVAFVESADDAAIEQALRPDSVRRRPGHLGGRASTRTRPGRSPRSTATACSAPTAKAPTASAAGTSWSSAGSPRTRTSTIYGAVVRRAPAAGDQQRLRARRLQRRDRRRGATGCADAARSSRAPSGSRSSRPGRLDAVETMHAMTIHKSQGSQADRVTVLLPDEGSRLLTRELFYTAVTRARQHVRVVGSEAAVRAAVGSRAVRATGLRLRLARAERPPTWVPDSTAHALVAETAPQSGAARVDGRLESVMPFLLRVELPDVPGSLGRVASDHR